MHTAAAVDDHEENPGGDSQDEDDPCQVFEYEQVSWGGKGGGLCYA